MTRRFLGALCAVVLLATAAGCSRGEGGEQGYIDGRVTQLEVADRTDPIELDGEDLDGEDLSLEQFRGRPAVVVVWGAWCGPCRKETPEVVSIAEEYDDRVGFVGINVRDASVEKAHAFVRNQGLPYPSFYSPDGEALLSFRGTLGPNSVPSIVVLDTDGRVAASILTSLPSRLTLTTLIDDVLAESDARAAGA